MKSQQQPHADWQLIQLRASQTDVAHATPPFKNTLPPCPPPTDVRGEGGASVWSRRCSVPSWPLCSCLSRFTRGRPVITAQRGEGWRCGEFAGRQVQRNVRCEMLWRCRTWCDRAAARRLGLVLFGYILRKKFCTFPLRQTFSQSGSFIWIVTTGAWKICSRSMWNYTQYISMLKGA